MEIVGALCCIGKIICRQKTGGFGESAAVPENRVGGKGEIAMSATSVQQPGGRVARWDYAKLLLIFLVVWGHFLDKHVETEEMARRAYMVIYTFHMPLFLFISGIFSKKNINQKRYGNIAFYLVIYYVIKILLCLSGWFEEERFKFSLLSENYIPWYAYALFVYSMVTILLRRGRTGYVLVCSVALACFAGYDEEVGSFLVLSKLLVFYPFFYLGYCMDGDKVLKVLSGRGVKLVSAVMLAIFVLVVYRNIDTVWEFQPLVIGRKCYVSSFENEKYVQWGALLRLGYYLVAGMVSAMVLSLVPGGKGGVLADFGSRSLQVYVIHGIFIKLLYGKYHGEEWLFQMGKPVPVLFLGAIAAVITLFCSLAFWDRIFAVLRRTTVQER